MRKSGRWPAITRWKLDPGLHHLTLERRPAPIEVAALVGRQPGPRLVFTAGVHGDEYEGVRALGELAQELSPDALHGTLLLVPVCNPEAFGAATRTSPLDGGNLNRSFPGRADGGPTERLAHLIMAELIRGADLLVDLHAGGTRYAFTTLAGYREMEGRVGADSRRAAWAFGLPHLWVMNPNPGVFSYEVCRAGVPALGVETTGTGGARAADIAALKGGLYGVLAAWGMLPGARPTPQPEPRRILRGAWTLCGATGLFRPRVALGERVRAGTLMAEILDIWSRPLSELRAENDGLVAAICHAGRVEAGDWAVWLMSESDAGEAGGV